MTDMAEKQKQWETIVAKAWEDEDYKRQLLSDPVSVFTQEGVEIPDGASVNVVEGKENEVLFFLPPKPSGERVITDVSERLAASSLIYVSSVIG
ncbi:NHLP leader peptide family RiPP precursor [Desulfovibrio inopinatus]|uniref:NHLP leader peptide family RiPP precursor n=1 Tax=Desulfovibrio inopinatus TaxID=102109 RepID=UPI000426CB3C|nr:NHLP leader peptide family RiPP precursor [Desulfovibrio inopinatus]